MITGLRLKGGGDWSWTSEIYQKTFFFGIDTEIYRKSVYKDFFRVLQFVICDVWSHIRHQHC